MKDESGSSQFFHPPSMRRPYEHAKCSHCNPICQVAKVTVTMLRRRRDGGGSEQESALAARLIHALHADRNDPIADGWQRKRERVVEIRIPIVHMDRLGRIETWHGMLREDVRVCDLSLRPPNGARSSRHVPIESNLHEHAVVKI